MHVCGRLNLKNEVIFEGTVNSNIVKAVTNIYAGEYVRLRIEPLASSFKPRIRRKRITLSERKTIQRLHERGKINMQIAKKLHRSPSAVGRVLSNAAV